MNKSLPNVQPEDHVAGGTDFQTNPDVHAGGVKNSTPSQSLSKASARQITACIETSNGDELASIFQRLQYVHLPAGIRCLGASMLFMQGWKNLAFEVVSTVQDPSIISHTFLKPLLEKYTAGKLFSTSIVKKNQELDLQTVLYLLESVFQKTADADILFQVGQFIECLLQSPQRAIGWYEKSRQRGGRDAVVSEASYYISSGQRQRGIQLLESSFELPSCSSEIEFEQEAKKREGIAKYLIQIYTELNEQGNALRIWSELRTRKQLLPDQSLYLPQLRFYDGSIEQISSLLNVGSGKPIPVSDILKYSDRVDMLLSVSEAEPSSDGKMKPLDFEVVSAACLLRNARARKELIGWVFRCLTSGNDADIETLAMFVDTGLPEGIVDLGEDFGPAEWVQQESDESKLPIRRIYLRGRLDSIFALLLDDCIFETDLEDVLQIEQCLNILYPAYSGNKAVFQGEKSIEILTLVAEKLRNLEAMKQALNASPLEFQKIVYFGRYSIDSTYGAQTKILAVKDLIEFKRVNIGHEYAPWLISELIIAGEFDAVLLLIQFYSEMGLWKQVGVGEGKIDPVDLFTVCKQCPDIFDAGMDISLMPLEIWNTERVAEVYLEYLLTNGPDETFTMEFAHFENQLIALEKSGRSVFKEQILSMSSALQALFHRAFDRLAQDGFVSEYIGKDEIRVSDENGISNESSMAGNKEEGDDLQGNGQNGEDAQVDVQINIQANQLDMSGVYKRLPVFLSIVSESLESDFPINAGMNRKLTEELVAWTDRLLPEKEYETLVWLVEMFTRNRQYSGLGKTSMTDRLDEIDKNLVYCAALYLAYCDVNCVYQAEAADESLIYGRLLGRRYLSFLEITETPNFVHDYWDLILLHFETSEQKTWLTAKILDSLQGEDLFVLDSRDALREIFLLEAMGLVNKSYTIEHRGDILGALFARISKVCIQWFADIENSEVFDGYANKFDPLEYSFHSHDDSLKNAFPPSTTIQ